MSDSSRTLAPPATCATTVRGLVMDAVQAANSGHPGGPMGLAAVGWTLFTRHLRHSPSNPEWPGRDRFVLSNGHASMLLYSLLHLTGYDLAMDDLRDFRQLDSRTPGHPERGEAPGVEITTGPLGQGVANAVGFALAERMMAADFNMPGREIVDNRTWFICSDGDLMEGISYEAASLAGFLRLEKLIGVFDDNRVSLDGPTSLTFAEDVPGRFAALGWRVLRIADGNDSEEIDRVLAEAAVTDGRPTMVIARTEIGYGSPNKQGSATSHGAPLGADEVELTKKALGLPPEPAFHVPSEVAAWGAECRQRGDELEAAWNERLKSYARAHPDLAEEFRRRSAHGLPPNWDEGLRPVDADAGAIATRAAGGDAINALAETMPELIQGAADLSVSTGTTIHGSPDVAPGEFSGRNIRFGVREHAMGAITNGITAYGGLRIACSTFLTFSDYQKNPIRLAALMGLPSIFVFTHDSIALGEDGPTHQPVEHIAALRAIPDLVTLRPADANETMAAWRVAIERTHGPTALVLSRQALPVLDADPPVHLGGYVAADGSDVAVVATGSEVSLAIAAREALAERGVSARVISLPSWELFAAQGVDYRNEILPPGMPKVAVEAASPLGWERWVGDGPIIAVERFGASAPGAVVMDARGVTVAACVDAALSRL
jgi:transketolase